MCVIIHMPAGSKIAFDKLSNACHNNWHSYGLVTRIDGKLDIKKVVPKNGEVNPLEVAALLDKDEEFERILHLRHNTAGSTNLRNCHPFDVYYDDTRQVVFMHNGTFFDYKPKKIDEEGKVADDPQGPSDSVSFAEENITPMLVRSGGSIEDPFFRKVVNKFWAHNNRGLLISSDQNPWFVGEDWKTIKAADGETKLRVSNDDYFDKVTRGPERDRRIVIEAKKREEENKNKKITQKTNATFSPTGKYAQTNNALAVPVFANRVSLPVQPLKDFDFTQPSLSQLSTSPVNICNDWDVYDREHLISLGNLTKDEWNLMYGDKATTLFIMDYMSSDYANLYAEHIELEEKLKKAQLHIEEMANQLKGKKQRVM